MPLTAGQANGRRAKPLHRGHDARSGVGLADSDLFCNPYQAAGRRGWGISEGAGQTEGDTDILNETYQTGDIHFNPV